MQSFDATGGGTWLTPDEVEQLTARQRWSTQCKMLAQMGIPFRPNAVGRPLVERAAVLKYPNGRNQPGRKTVPRWED